MCSCSATSPRVIRFFPGKLVCVRAAGKRDAVPLAAAPIKCGVHRGDSEQDSEGDGCLLSSLTAIASFLIYKCLHVSVDVDVDVDFRESCLETSEDTMKEHLGVKTTPLVHKKGVLTEGCTGNSDPEENVCFSEENSIGRRKRQSLQHLEGCLKDVAVDIFSSSSSSEDAVVQLCKVPPDQSRSQMDADVHMPCLLKARLSTSALSGADEKWMRCLHLKTWFKLYPPLSQVDLKVGIQLSVM
ncbi:hypothetical protein AV530_016085 [Patagioenas fasciata monilis]|uniref:Uncharacterized protein n=1 Tax=Patagioenas fasciata monilis TaxID=372326 RepID=A0A1V4KJZ5_PATFA|nr:hypothetical protein AV530_016085 [Patagioenas fasciata monilis]